MNGPPSMCSRNPRIERMALVPLFAEVVRYSSFARAHGIDRRDQLILSDAPLLVLIVDFIRLVNPLPSAVNVCFGWKVDIG